MSAEASAPAFIPRLDVVRPCPRAEDARHDNPKEWIMLRHSFIALALASLLAGCAGPSHPEVYVNRDAVRTVTPDDLRFRPDSGAVVITWHVRGEEHRFPHDGVVIEGELDRPGGAIARREQSEIGDCAPLAEGRMFQCIYRNSRPGVFEYSVRVLDQKGRMLAPVRFEIGNLS
jgi:hypothetical protein